MDGVRLVTMEAYFDESGIHNGARVCVVAGFYGQHLAWRNFENRWNAILADYPELDGEGFHAKRFYGRAKGKRIGRYKGWTDEKAADFLERLAVCIESSREVSPIGFAVVAEDFLALPRVNRQWFTGAKFSKRTGKALTSGCPNKPYYLPFSFCVLRCAQKSDMSPDEKVQMYVGLDRTFHGYASSLCKFLIVDDRIPSSLRSKLGTLSNPLAKDTPGLQAADLLAYIMYHASLVALDLTQKGKVYHPSAFLMRLLQNWQGEPTVRLMNAELLSKIEEAGQAEYRKLISQT